MMKTCPDCGGSGKGVGTRERQADGWVGTTSQPCGRCNGSGQIYDSSSPPTRSSGHQPRQATAPSRPQSSGGASRPAAGADQSKPIDGIVGLAGAGAGAYAGFSVLPDNGWAMLIGALIGGGLAWRFKGPLKVIIVLAMVGGVVWSIMQSQG
jgi:hypothetical protein